MKKAILFSMVFMVIVGFTPSENEEDRILYVFPDDVEISLNNYIERLKKSNEDFRFNLTLYREGDREYRVFVNYYEQSKRHLIDEVDTDWPELTNRYVIINNVEYPVLLDYDFDFGTANPLDIGEFGNRDGMVLRTTVINEGFSVKFNKSGIVQ